MEKNKEKRGAYIKELINKFPAFDNQWSDPLKMKWFKTLHQIVKFADKKTPK